MTDINDTTLCHPRVSRDDPMRQQSSTLGPYRRKELLDREFAIVTLGMSVAFVGFMAAWAVGVFGS